MNVNCEKIDGLRKEIDDLNQALKKAKSELAMCRNELCLRCGEYKMRHKGACDGCRWKDGGR